MILQVSHTHNSMLVNELIVWGVLQPNPHTIDEPIYLEVYEGRKHWFIIVPLYDEADEIIIPKIISRCTAINIARYISLSECCKYIDDIKDNLVHEINAMEETYKNTKDAITKKIAYDAIMKLHESLQHKINYIDNLCCKNYIKVYRWLRKLGIIPLNYISFYESDIDKTWFFYIGNM